MSLLSEGTVANDQCLIRQTFQGRRWVQDANGVLVGCTVGRYDGDGLRPTAASSRVTYGGTSAWLINSNKMTIRTSFRTGAVVPNNKYLICKGPIAFNDNQWLQIFAAGQLYQYIANAAADVGNYAVCNTAVVASTSYVMHTVFDGALAAGSRIAFYIAGVAQGVTITGTIPTSMRASASPITIFQANGGVVNSPDTDFTLYDFAIWQRAFSASEVALDAAGTTFATGGP